MQESKTDAPQRGGLARSLFDSTDALSLYWLDRLARHFSPRRVRYIAKVLTANELDVISDLRDALIIARIKRMKPQRLDRMDDMVPCSPHDQRLYCTLQADWVRAEQYLVGTRLGRSPTHREVFSDFINHRNGLRFRAYFSMKYPDRMKLGVGRGGGSKA